MSLLRFAPLLLFAAAPLGLLAGEPPEIVSVVGSDSKLIVGELSRESETQIELLDLKTGEQTVLAKADAKAIRRDLTDKSVIDKAGLPTYFAWRVFHAAPEGPVAVLPIGTASGSESEGSKRLVGELTTALVNRGLSVVERASLAQALEELELQQGAAFDAEKATKIGGQLGASAVVVGTLTAKGKLAETQLRLVDVETGEILVAVTHSAKDDAVVAEAMETASRRSEGLIVGTFEVFWTESTGKQGSINYTFEPNGGVVKGKEKIGTWGAEGATVRIDFFDPVRGTVTISPADRSAFEAVHTWGNGDKSVWIGKRVE